MSNARNLANLLGTGTQITTADIADGAFQANKNLIINGAMQVAARGTSFTLGSDAYTLDRVRYDGSSVSGGMTLTQETDAPIGFSNSLKVECTSTSSNNSNERARLFLGIVEGQDVQGILSESFTISFYVKASKTGTLALLFLAFGSSVNNIIGRTVTINSADTWERKTITLSSPPTSDIPKDNSLGFRFEIYMNAGADFTTGSEMVDWLEDSSGYATAYGHTFNVMENVNDTLQITGVQLELGDTATPFEHRSYSDELARCQRYYFKSGGFYSYSERKFYTLPTTMRAAPSVSVSGPTTNRGRPDFIQFNSYEGESSFNADAEL